MKITEIYESKNPGYKPGEPYWELDSVNKVYTVHQQDGTEVSRYPYEHVWDSSPAMRKAKEDYKKVYSEYYAKKKDAATATAEAKPLSSIEKEYIDLSRKIRQYMNTYSMVDDETKAVYDDQMKKWSARLDQLSDPRIIRNSVIMGTYKPPA